MVIGFGNLKICRNLLYIKNDYKKGKGEKMSKVYCPNCGSEVKLPEKSSIGIGMTISKETKGNFALPLETVRNNNTTEYGKENKNNVEKRRLKL